MSTAAKEIDVMANIASTFPQFGQSLRSLLRSRDGVFLRNEAHQCACHDDGQPGTCQCETCAGTRGGSKCPKTRGCGDNLGARNGRPGSLDELPKLCGCRICDETKKRIIDMMANDFRSSWECLGDPTVRSILGLKVLQLYKAIL